jgi:hypothetical protein
MSRVVVLVAALLVLAALAMAGQVCVAPAFAETDGTEERASR